MRYSLRLPNVKEDIIRPAAMLSFMIVFFGCAAPQKPALTTELSATSTVRINVINFTTQPAPFTFRFGGIQQLDTIAPPGSLGVPVLSRSLHVAPGLYRMQLFDKSTRKVAQDSLESGGKGGSFATVELIFDVDGWSITTCHCSRVYGRGGTAAGATAIRSFAWRQH